MVQDTDDTDDITECYSILILDYHLACSLLMTFYATMYSLPSTRAPKADITYEGMLIRGKLMNKRAGYSTILKML